MFRILVFIFAVISTVACHSKISQHKYPFKESIVPKETLPVGEYRTLTISGSRSTVVSSDRGAILDRLLAVYDPQVLAGLWDRIRSNSTCHEEMGAFLRDLDAARIWAIRMADASGRYNGGFFWGNDYWMGSYTHCHHIYDAPFPLAFFVFKAHIKIDPNFSPNYRHILLGVCLPKSCKTNEAEDIVKLSSDQIGVNHNRTVLISCTKSNHVAYEIFADPLFWILVCVTVISGTLVAVGTYLEQHNEAAKAGHEVKINDLRTENLSMTNGFTGNNDKTNQWKEIAVSFSLRRNLETIFEIQSGYGTIPSIHGLRVITMGWIISLHTLIVTFRYSDNIEFRAVAETFRIFNTINMGGLAVDTFFFISGLLASFHYFRSSAKLDVSKSPSGFKTSVIEFVQRFYYRWARLTIPYIYVMGVFIICARWLQDYSLFEPLTYDNISCEVNWWRNLIYINNWFPAGDMCMFWSWYLADDTQFFVLGIILLILAVKHFRVALVLMAVLLVSSWVTTAMIAYGYHHSPTTDDPFWLFDEIYDKPWTRLGPYLIGMSAGWILFKTDCKVRMNKFWVIVGWTLSTGGLAFLVYGLHGIRLNRLTAAAFSSLSHSAWAACLTWVVIACSTGYGGWVTKILSASSLHPFSKVTYCAYLIHPVVQITFSMTPDSPVHLGVELLILIWIGHVVISYAVSFVISLLFEVPFLSLLRTTVPAKRRKYKEAVDTLQSSPTADKKVN